MSFVAVNVSVDADAAAEVIVPAEDIDEAVSVVAACPAAFVMPPVNVCDPIDVMLTAPVPPKRVGIADV